MSLSAGNIISVALALAWVGGIYAYWRRDEKRRLEESRSAGGAGATEAAERSAGGKAKSKADTAEPVD